MLTKTKRTIATRIRNLSFEENFLIICIGNIMKTLTKRFQNAELKFPRK